MDWQDKLGDLVLGGLAGTLGSALPPHWRRLVRERLGDLIHTTSLPVIMI